MYLELHGLEAPLDGPTSMRILVSLVVFSSCCGVGILFLLFRVGVLSLLLGVGVLSLLWGDFSSCCGADIFSLLFEVGWGGSLVIRSISFICDCLL